MNSERYPPHRPLSLQHQAASAAAASAAVAAAAPAPAPVAPERNFQREASSFI